MISVKGLNKFVISLAASTILFSTVGVSVANAAVNTNGGSLKDLISKEYVPNKLAATNLEPTSSEVKQAVGYTTFDPSKYTLVSATDVESAKVVLKDLGFSEESLLNFSDKDLVYMSQQALNPQVRVGVSTVAKAIVKVWKMLPAPVKAKIAEFGGLEGLLKAIDHFTGGEEKIITSSLNYIGIHGATNWWIMKTITLFI